MDTPPSQTTSEQCSNTVNGVCKSASFLKPPANNHNDIILLATYALQIEEYIAHVELWIIEVYRQWVGWLEGLAIGIIILLQ
jgi:hypothetical protein